MRIALLGSVTSVIPPTGQAAIERLVLEQALGLAKRGHKVLLFAPSGSTVSHENITLIPIADKVLLTGTGKEGVVSEEALYGASYKLRLEVTNVARVVDEMIAHKDEYDVVLNNLRSEAVVWSVASHLGKKLYHIMHLPLFPELVAHASKHHVGLISISNAQRKAFPDASYAGTVYNAVDTGEFTYNSTPENYVLYLGSIGQNKNPKDAILAAKAAGVPIKIGGRIKDQPYYDHEIAPLIDGTSAIWVGEQHPKDIIALYQHAKAFLFPTLWEEPFGLVMIEAMSSGTPVIAYSHGAVPEVIQEGKNGYMVNSIDEMAQKIRDIGVIDRALCRKIVEEKFSLEEMVESYEKILSLSSAI